jgi:Flp pilus assembly protein TadG
MKPDVTKGQRGSVLVESALTLLTFVVVLLGIVEAGRLLSLQQSINNAAREGVRLAVLPLTQTSTLPSDADITAQARRYLDAAGISGGTIAITRPITVDTGPVNTTFTRVTVTVPYQLVTVSMFSSQQFSLTGSALMRNETSD